MSAFIYMYAWNPCVSMHTYRDRFDGVLVWIYRCALSIKAQSQYSVHRDDRTFTRTCNTHIQNTRVPNRSRKVSLCSISRSTLEKVLCSNPKPSHSRSASDGTKGISTEVNVRNIDCVCSHVFVRAYMHGRMYVRLVGDVCAHLFVLYKVILHIYANNIVSRSCTHASTRVCVESVPVVLTVFSSSPATSATLAWRPLQHPPQAPNDRFHSS